jgi:hypothetical protein
LLICLVLAAGDSSISNVNQFSLKPVKNGTTFQATVWPCVENNWAGRFSCNNCNPFTGDVYCNASIPILCLTFAKSINRPYYSIAVQLTPFSVVDGGYYDGWTGGVFQVTPPVRGYDISSYQVGDQLCKGYFGPQSKFAQFNDGYYMPTMNQVPVKAWNLWDWSLAKQGAWNFWGFFNHHYRGRTWVWVDGQPNGNCGN